MVATLPSQNQNRLAIFIGFLFFVALIPAFGFWLVGNYIFSNMVQNDFGITLPYMKYGYCYALTILIFGVGVTAAILDKRRSK